MRKMLDRPYVLLTLAAFFWSGNMVFARGLRANVPPIALAFWRWTIVAMLVLPFALPSLKAQWPQLRRSWRAVLVLALLGVAGFNTIAYVALQYTTATNATLLNSFIPVATMTMSWVLLGKRLARVEGVGVVVSFAGVVAIVSRGDVGTLIGLKLNVGDLWMLVAVLVWAGYTIGLQQWRPKGVDPMLMLAALTIVGLGMLVPWYAWELARGRSISVSPMTLLGIGYTGVFPAFLGYVFYNRGVALVGANRGSLFIHLMPAFGTLLSAIFLSERPRWFHFMGIGLIFFGIFLTTRARVQLQEPRAGLVSR